MTRQKAKNIKNKKTIIFMAPIPPPYMGPSIATEVILNSRFVAEFNVIHIDTADRRPLDNIGKVDLTNIYLSLKHYFQLFQNLLFSNADLVYFLINQTAIGFFRDFPFVVISKIARKKVVLHFRGGDFEKFYNNTNIFMKFVIRKTFSRIDRMIILCSALKQFFSGLIAEDKISIVPNGLDISFEKNKNSETNKKKILFLSSLRESKGVWQVLFSVKKVVKFNRDTRFIFAGSWRNENDRIKCEQYIKKEGLSDYIKFKGFIYGAEKVNLLQEANVFVLPSFSEGHPWVIIEAMAAGLPIVATDTGCIRESVIDGENGFIISRRDSDSLADRLIYLVEHPEEIERMGEKSREFYKQNFTKGHFVKRMISCINATLIQ